MSTRVRLSLLATFAGWLVSTVLTLLLFELPELWANATPGRAVLDIASGFALWAAFTLLVSALVWCVLVLPLALVLSAGWVVRYRRPIAAMSSVGAVLFIGWRLGTWKDLTEHCPGSPITRLFLAYAGFGFLYALVTTLVYAALLRRPRHPTRAASLV